MNKMGIGYGGIENQGRIKGRFREQSILLDGCGGRFKGLTKELISIRKSEYYYRIFLKNSDKKWILVVPNKLFSARFNLNIISSTIS